MFPRIFHIADTVSVSFLDIQDRGVYLPRPAVFRKSSCFAVPPAASIVLPPLVIARVVDTYDPALLQDIY